MSQLEVTCMMQELLIFYSGYYRSLDYAVHSCFRKIFATTDQSVVEQCMLYFECHHVQDTMGDRRRGFLHKFRMLQNQLCMALNDTATADLELR